MSTAAIYGRGSEFRIGDGATPTEGFTKIAEVRDVNDLNPQTRQFADATSQDSPGGFDEVIPTILQNENLTFELNFIPDDATQDHLTGLRYDHLNGTLRDFQVKYPSPNPYREDFSAYVVSVKVKLPHSDIIRATVTLRPSGQWNTVTGA